MSRNLWTLLLVALTFGSPTWAVVPGETLSEADDMTEMAARMVEIAELVLDGDHKHEAGDDAAAVDLYEKAIALIGEDYNRGEPIADDSGTKLQLARLKEKEGKMRDAQALLRGVIEDRLEILHNQM